MSRPWAIWRNRATVTMAAFLCCLIALLPLGPFGTPSVLPDLVLCLLAVVVLRRPDAAPPLMVAALAYATDLLLNRPVGLTAVMTLAVTETLRAAAPQIRELPLVVEWASFSVATLLSVAVTGVVLSLSFAGAPPARDLLIYGVLTALAWAPVWLVVAYGLGLRRPRPDARTIRGFA